MSTAKPPLSDRMKVCCHWYALTGNWDASVRRAFFRHDQRDHAARLFSSPQVTAYLQEISAVTPAAQEPGVRDGYRRIAFGPIGDAVRLMFTPEDEIPNVERLDLFSVSQLRRGKGTLEIVFFDRLDALDRLARQEADAPDRSALGFYEAMQAGAAALEEHA